MDIRDRIKAVRNHFKLNQTEFGDRVGLSQSSITAIENGKREIPQHLIKVISVQFGVSEDWLQTEKGDMLSGDNEPNPDDAILSDFIAPTMNPKKKRILGHIARTLDGMSDTELKSLCEILCGIADDVKDDKE